MGGRFSSPFQNLKGHSKVRQSKVERFPHTPGHLHFSSAAMFVFYIIIYGEWNNMGNSGTRVYLADGVTLDPKVETPPS